MLRIIKPLVKLCLATVVVSVLASCSLLPKEEAELTPPLVKPAQENYSTAKVEKGTLTKAINGSGTFESLSTDIAQFTGQGGRIDKIMVKSGDQVKKGDVLAQLLLDGLDLQVKEQELALERAKYAHDQALGGDKQTLKITTLQLEIEQIKYDRIFAQFSSKQLVAHIDGQVVFAESLKAGDFIEPYQTLVIVADPTKLRIALRVENPNDIAEVDVGAAADVKVSDELVKGKVVQTPSSSPTTPNKELADKYAKTLYIELPVLPKEISIGQIADVKIITQQRDNVVKIPRGGLRSYMDRNFVRILEDGNRLREIDVEPGLVASTEVEIIKGLEEGQVIVLQ
ncbi:efflux RND transporter periplasmic adaptor subunit [Paenibacillus eucommiae]|uniref:efflux RND transporter periplasmic adaptor subunit n=1 Tax=Paenibacillus eucommiae TaxID=1355755 RepID=UPI001AE33DF1|nr:efflux RND transporter periplasmic adaptor subunit [Paenibacillus eucommiae]